MKKATAFLIALVMALMLAPASLAKQPTFTLLVYLCGTDLESDGGMATKDLFEMVASGVTADESLKVIVQTGGTKSWQVDGLNDRQAQRWILSGTGLEELDSLGKLNMGAESTLTDFLKFGVKTYPADRYGLVLWDHGGGSSGGVCYDELTDDCLLMDEIGNALAAVSKQKGYNKFAFVGFDACMMSTYEMANVLEPYAEYMVASEELEPGSGWDYTPWIKQLAQDTAIGIPELGTTISQTFLSAVTYGDYGTLAVIDLSALPELRKALEGMGATLLGEVDGGNFRGLSQLRQSVRSFGETDSAASDMIDLKVFADLFAKYDKTSAKAIKTALKKLIVHNGYTSNLSGICGMSVLVPFSTVWASGEYLSAYDASNASPQYTAFVKGMIGQYGSSGGYTFGSTSVQTESTQTAMLDWFSQYATDSSSYYDCYTNSCDTSDGSDFDIGNILSTIFGSDSTDYNSAASGGSLWGDLLGDDDDDDVCSLPDNSCSSASFGDLWSGITPDDSTLTVQTGSGEVSIANPFAGTTSEYAYTVSLSEEDMAHLGKVEANLMMDMSDPDFECYVDLGYDHNVLVDWDNGKVYGLFNGTWSTLDGQMVCIVDQVANEMYVRSLIPVTVNGLETYLLVIFDETNPGGKVVGYTEGYTASGMPARGYDELQSGDVVIPQYELVYWDDDGNQQSEPFEGDPITVGGEQSSPYAYSAVESDASYVYGFCLNDIYGDYQYTDFTTLTF